MVIHLYVYSNIEEIYTLENVSEYKAKGQSIGLLSRLLLINCY